MSLFNKFFNFYAHYILVIYHFIYFLYLIEIIMAEENNNNNEIDNNIKKQNSEKVDLFVTSIDNFKELKEEVYVNKIKDLEKCKNI